MSSTSVKPTSGLERHQSPTAAHSVTPQSKLSLFCQKYHLTFLIFCCGAIEMSLELTAARVFSPYVGSSTPVWTIIIGMMLIFMSAGYYLGGKLADRTKSIQLLSLFLTVAGIYIATIPLLEIAILEPIARTIQPLELAAFCASFIILGPPSLLIATASPFVVKLQQLSDRSEVGSISGRTSAASTIGNILGTFLTGFLLLPGIGNRLILLGCSIILLCISILLQPRSFRTWLANFSSIIIAIMLYFVSQTLYHRAHPEVLSEQDSLYSRIQVKSYIHNNKQYKHIRVGAQGSESYSTTDVRTIASYNYYFDLANVFLDNYRSILLIGGAGYTYPTYFYSQPNNTQTMDVVEIDPAMTQIAIQDFQLNLNNPLLNVIHQDGRSYLNQSTRNYDAIFLDAFKGVDAPFELTTAEALQKAYQLLNPQGVIITNIVSSRSGTQSSFLAHAYATYSHIFDNVQVYQVNPTLPPTALQNFILIGFKGTPSHHHIAKYQHLLQNIIDYQSNASISTDNHAPIGS